MKNDVLTARRFEELFDRAYLNDTTEYTNFLSLAEINTLINNRIPCEFYGGYDEAERCIAAFGDNPKFPITCIKIEPKSKKFSEWLGHRDFLGAIIGAGVVRDMIGDIIVKDSVAYVFCQNGIADYLVHNIDKVRRTPVICSIAKELPEFINEKPELSNVIVPSLRVDAVIAAVYKLSRNESSKLIKAEKVFINQCLETKESKLLEDGDIVSLRGIGRFVFENAERRTKKGRIVIEIRKYK